MVTSYPQLVHEIDRHTAQCVAIAPYELQGFIGGVLEIVLRHRRDAFRIVYAVQIGADIWVLHAFQKKSTQGIKTPKHEIDLVHDRLKRLKEVL